MALQIFQDLPQGSSEWKQARAGIVTASVVGKLITAKTMQPALNDTARLLTRQLVAERITGIVEDTPTSSAMLRGTLDEPYARDIYAEHYAPVTEVGFQVRELPGVRIGFSPDGLVGDDGIIEIKSRQQKHQLETIFSGQVPGQYMAQIQCGLLVSGREWCDFVSYSGGLPLFVKRVKPDDAWQQAVVDAAATFEDHAERMIAVFHDLSAGMPPTEYIDHFEEMDI